MNVPYRICLALFLLSSEVSRAVASEEDDLIKAFLHNNFDDKNYGMVIGIVDEHGMKVFSAGKAGRRVRSGDRRRYDF
jgi:hypothetical protein